jgi:hypothetical protein
MPAGERGETAWKWSLRLMGVVGFVYLLDSDSTAPGLYILVAGLLGLPNILAYQLEQNRRRRRGGA